MSDSFDSHSQNYEEVLQDAVKLSGYDPQHFVRAKLKKLKRLFSGLVEQSFRFLDYGCGVGNLYSEFSQYFPRGIYTGVDASPKMVETARSKFGNNSPFFHVGDYDWKHQDYDLIFSAGVFHHIPPAERRDHLLTLVDRLVPGGFLGIWEHNPWNPMTCKIVRDCEFDKDAVLISSLRLKQDVRRAGISKARIIYTSFFPRFLALVSVMEDCLEEMPFGGQYVVIGQKPL